MNKIVAIVAFGVIVTANLAYCEEPKKEQTKKEITLKDLAPSQKQKDETNDRIEQERAKKIYEEQQQKKKEEARAREEALKAVSPPSGN